jgi:hypothetical protein
MCITPWFCGVDGQPESIQPCMRSAPPLHTKKPKPVYLLQAGVSMGVFSRTGANWEAGGYGPLLSVPACQPGLLAAICPDQHLGQLKETMLRLNDSSLVRSTHGHQALPLTDGQHQLSLKMSGCHCVSRGTLHSCHIVTEPAWHCISWDAPCTGPQVQRMDGKHWWACIGTVSCGLQIESAWHHPLEAFNTATVPLLPLSP